MKEAARLDRKSDSAVPVHEDSHDCLEAWMISIPCSSVWRSRSWEAAGASSSDEVLDANMRLLDSRVPSTTLGISRTGAVNQQMEDLFLSPSLLPHLFLSSHCLTN